MRLKNNFLFLLLFSLSSCYGMCHIEPKYTEEAHRLYSMLGTYRVWLNYEEAYEIFGDCYRQTDMIFVSQNIFKKKYILVRFGEPITYAEEDKWIGF